jgi:hypothetical protein
VDGGALHADLLALHRGGRDVMRQAALAHHPGRGVLVLLGEEHRLLALLGDGHRGDDGVELARLQGRDHAVPLLLHQGALGLHLGAQGHRDVDVEALELAVGADLGERG